MLLNGFFNKILFILYIFFLTNKLLIFLKLAKTLLNIHRNILNEIKDVYIRN